MLSGTSSLEPRLARYWFGEVFFFFLYLASRSSGKRGRVVQTAGAWLCLSWGQIIWVASVVMRATCLEEGTGFFELGSWCAEDRMAGIWGLEGKKKYLPRRPWSSSEGVRDRVELRASLLAQLWWLTVVRWGADSPETIRCSVQTPELKLTDAGSKLFTKSLLNMMLWVLANKQTLSKARVSFQGETPKCRLDLFL